MSTFFGGSAKRKRKIDLLLITDRPAINDRHKAESGAAVSVLSL
jgi:hypothetical protein